LTAITLNKNELRKKISALIHFSIRSGTAVIGQNRIDTEDAKKIGLVLINSDTSSNTVRNIGGLVGESKIQLLDSDFDLSAETGKDGVKVIGFRNSELQSEIAKLIKQYMRESENER